MMQRNDKRLNGVIALAILVISFFFVSGCTKGKESEVISFSESLMLPAQILEEPVEGGVNNNTFTSLSVPTQAVKIGEDYFLVDCYHNQVLFSQDPDTELLLPDGFYRLIR